MIRRSVFLDGEPLPDDGESYVCIPKGNDRMWAIELNNHGRITRGTATVWRLRALFEAVHKRHPDCVRSQNITRPLVIRSRRAGRIIVTATALEGPVRSIATVN